MRPCYFNVGLCACHAGPGCLADPPPTDADRAAARDAVRAAADFAQQMHRIATSRGPDPAEIARIKRGVAAMAVPDDCLISTKMAAYALGISPGAFRAWAKRRHIKATAYRRTHPKGHPSAMWDMRTIAAAASAGRTIDPAVHGKESST